MSDDAPPFMVEESPKQPAPPTAPKGRRNRAPFRAEEARISQPNKSQEDLDDENDAPNDDAANLPPGAASMSSKPRSRQQKPPPQTQKSGWGEESLSNPDLSKKQFGRRSQQARDSRRNVDEDEKDRDDDRDDEDEDDDDEDEENDRRKSRGSHARDSKNKNKRGAAGRDEVIMIIPDLNDVEEDEMITTVAAPPSLKVNKVKTIRELDNELAISTGMLSEPGMEGIDFSLLTAYALCPPEMVYEEDRHWDWDVTFTELTSGDKDP
ncbi:Intraflagellar transport protein 43 [Rhizoclosmatium sp. JEL0117]|nr:Intraflagellar transport protein 43 [Rhizoclosmatium sp. JEL0117]